MHYYCQFIDEELKPRKIRILFPRSQVMKTVCLAPKPLLFQCHFVVTLDNMALWGKGKSYSFVLLFCQLASYVLGTRRGVVTIIINKIESLLSFSLCSNS